MQARDRQARAKTRAQSAEFQYRQHYRLAETDPRFLALTPDAILTELWAIWYSHDPKRLSEPDGDSDFEQTLQEMGLGDGDEWEPI